MDAPSDRWLEKIVDSYIAELEQHVHTRLGERSFDIDVTSAAPQLLRVVVMTGSTLSADETAVCERQDFRVLPQPFLVNEVVALVQSIVLRPAAAAL